MQNENIISKTLNVTNCIIMKNISTDLNKWNKNTLKDRLTVLRIIFQSKTTTLVSSCDCHVKLSAWNKHIQHLNKKKKKNINEECAKRKHNKQVLKILHWLYHAKNKSH